MRILELLSPDAPSFSFEFFPPRTEEGMRSLFENVTRLGELEPDFVSVTYGAAGSTREGTVEVASRLQAEHGIETMGHLSCVGETTAGLESLLGRLGDAGISNVLALRGDPPSGDETFRAPEDGLEGSVELAAFIRERGEWGIGASCFPEVHPEARSPEADIAYLKQKVAAGAEFLITQLFFDNAVFFRWLAQVRAAGIEVPILVGILPIRTAAGIKRMASLCGAGIPAALEAGLAGCGGDPAAEKEFGIAYAAAQADELLAAGVDGLHFYTLNHADSTMAVLGALKATRPWERVSSAGADPAIAAS